MNDSLWPCHSPRGPDPPPTLLESEHLTSPYIRTKQKAEIAMWSNNACNVYSYNEVVLPGTRVPQEQSRLKRWYLVGTLGLCYLTTSYMYNLSFAYMICGDLDVSRYLSTWRSRSHVTLMNKNCPAMAPARISRIPAYLDVNLYNADSAIQYKIAARALLEALSIASSGFKGSEIVRVRVSTIDSWRICIATMAMIPITEPTKPSRKGPRSYEPNPWSKQEPRVIVCIGIEE